MSFLVPEAYAQAHLRGAPREERMEIIRGLCEEALASDAAKIAGFAPGYQDNDLVAVTFDMYEYILAAPKSGE